MLFPLLPPPLPPPLTHKSVVQLDAHVHQQQEHKHTCTPPFTTMHARQAPAPNQVRTILHQHRAETNATSHPLCPVLLWSLPTALWPRPHPLSHSPTTPPTVPDQSTWPHTPPTARRPPAVCLRYRLRPLCHHPSWPGAARALRTPRNILFCHFHLRITLRILRILLGPVPILLILLILAPPPSRRWGQD